MKNEMEEFYDVWRRRLEEKERCIEQMRAIKHDMQAHLIVLQYYLESGMYEEARAYLKGIRDVQMSINMGIEIDTGNSLINAIIEEYVSRDKEINFWCEGKFPENINISDYELCILFSNLMSNAVEACGRITELPKEINMKLAVILNQLQIKLENYIEWDMDTQLLGSGTTKKDTDSHGYGVKNLKKVIEKHNGDIDFEIIKNKFCVSINIPIIEI